MSGKNFSSLHELFDGDEDAIKNVLRVFVEDIPRQLKILEENILKNDFHAAQIISHKILPIFMQIEQEELSIILKRMDELRGGAAENYLDWKDDLQKFIKEAGELIEKIRNYIDT
jgi:hypothetical protein